jgi:hypothetical protein
MLARKWYWIFFTSIVMLLCFVSFWQFQYLTNRNSGGSGLNISVDPKKFYSPLDKRTFIENRDRTNTVVISLTPSFFDLVHLVTGSHQTFTLDKSENTTQKKMDLFDKTVVLDLLSNIMTSV